MAPPTSSRTKSPPRKFYFNAFLLIGVWGGGGREKNYFFLSQIISGIYRRKLKVLFQTQLFGLHFKAFLLKLEIGSLFSFISICCWGQWDDSCPVVWLYCLHFTSPLFSPTVGKLPSKNRSIKIMTPCHLMTCPALVKFQLKKNQERRRDEWNRWLIRNKLLTSQHLNFHSSWIKMTFLICFTSKFASLWGIFLIEMISL